MDPAKKLAAFDFESLREAFKHEVREHNVSASDWPEFAKKFLQRVSQESGEEQAAQRKQRFQAIFR